MPYFSFLIVCEKYLWGGIKFMMRKIVNRLVVIFVLIIALAIGGLFIMSYYFGDETKKIVVNELSNSLNIEVSVADIQFSVFENFPYASVEFTDIQTKEKLNGNSGSLLKAEKLWVLFNIYDIINRNYNIEKVFIKNAFLNIIVHNDDSTNFDIFKLSGKKSTSVKINLQKVNFQNVQISYINIPSDQEYLFRIDNGKMNGAFSASSYALDVAGDFYSQHIKSGKTVFLKKRNLKIDLKIDVDNKKSIYRIASGKINVAGLFFDVSGIVKSGLNNRFLDIEISANKSELSSFLALVPTEYKEPVKDYKLEGELLFNAKIKGNFSGNKLPDIFFDFELENGKFDHPETGVSLKDVAFKGTFENGKSKTKKSFKLNLSEFKADIKSGHITGELTIINFEKPDVLVAIKSGIDLNDIDDFIKIDNLKSLTGRLDMNLLFENKLRNFRKFTINDFISSKTSGSLKISDVNVKLQNSHVKYDNINGSFKFNNKDLIVNKLTGNIAGSDFKLKGYFLNILAYAFLPGEKINVKADFSSSNLNIDDLLKYQVNKNDTIYKLKFSDRLNFDLDMNIKNLKFRKFKAENIIGRFKMKGKKLFIENASLNSMEGKIDISGTVDETNKENFRIDCKADFKDVNIHELFYELGDFGQKSITSSNLSGKVNAHVIYKSNISLNLKIDPKSVYTLSDIVITDGELINYKPLYKLSKYIKQKELEHIRFSTLKNQIQIKDEIITFPEMDVESSTLNINISGTHTFQNQIDYRIKVLLSDLLSKKKRKEDEIEGIFTQDDGLGRTTLFLKMTGDANDPEIKYDTKAVRTKISSDLKSQKEELKDAFRKEFIREDKKEETEKEYFEKKDSGQADFKIEWEEDTADIIKDTAGIKYKSKKRKKQTIKKEGGKSDFIIEWDEDDDTIK
ncbi:MAG: hypothetical protein B6D61_04165 [Bacteroidetes bacterium 4484_249]|nr:MAG: hypothetical protein B6D61_04165 [Bacteroidetes bacterium 4484_249]